MDETRVHEILMYLFALIIAIPVHEFAHARSAVSYGDDTPRRDGRLTIFPWDHFDLFGGLMCIISSIVGFGIGWGKPVCVNPVNLRHPRWDGVKIAAWGPFSNLLLAILFAIPLRFALLGDNRALYNLVGICLDVNLGLLFFNMIPIHPLDGSKVLAGFLPDDLAYRYGRFMAQWGPMMLMLLIFAGRPLIELFVWEPAVRIAALLIGS
jgi:Zn-dependent protease